MKIEVLNEKKLALRDLTAQELELVSGGDNSNGGQNHDPVPDEEPAHDIPNPYPWDKP